jgi:prepilin-type processing-associated H-X9-DG protein
MNRICSILAVVLCFFGTSVRADDASNRATSLNQLKTLGRIVSSFIAAHNGRFPKTLDELIASDKSPDPSLLIAPMATDKTKPSYELLLPGEYLSKVSSPARTVLIRSRYKLADDRISVLFVDGHVELLDAIP